MNIELLIEDSENGTLYDVSALISDMTYNIQIAEYPSKLEFNLVPTNQVKFYEGSKVRLKIDGKGVFFGYVFSRSRSNTLSVTAYDQIRYLQNKSTAIFTSMSSAQIFERICREQQLTFRIVDHINHIVPSKIQDNKSFYEMIQEALDDTLIHTGKWFIIRDHFGVLEHIELESLRTNLVIGDSSLLTQYDYSSNIDEETANQVKLVHEVSDDQNQDAPKRREVYIAKDSVNIARWGLLQEFQTITDESNPAQLKQRADRLLQLKNKPKKKLSLSCLGDLRLTAGSSFFLNISDLVDEKVSGKFAIVTNCTHTFKNNMHTMDLEIEVI